MTDESKYSMLVKLRAADAAYYHSGVPIMTDAAYDALRERFVALHGDADLGVGAPPAPTSSTSVPLPVFMGSLSKLKPSDGKALRRWTATYPGPHFLRTKLDGISALYWADADGKPWLASRHDGVTGEDLRKLLPALRHGGLPDLAPGQGARGELVVSKATFRAKHTGKPGRTTMRNAVAGLVSSVKSLDADLTADLHFVAYEWVPDVTDARTCPPFPDQASALTTAGFPHVVTWRRVPVADMGALQSAYADWRDGSEGLYDMDGVVFSDGASHPRSSDPCPKHALAFKMRTADQLADTVVVAVQWNPSRFGVLKPTLQVEPVTIAGVRYEFCSGKHAQYIVQTRLGPGARVTIARANDVIPDVDAVHAPAPGGPSLPPDGTFRWLSDVEIEETVPSDDTAVKALTFFWRALGVRDLAEASVQALFTSGFGTVSAMAAMTARDISGVVPGVAEKKATAWVRDIGAALRRAGFVDVLYGSCACGRGVGPTKLALVADAVIRAGKGRVDAFWDTDDAAFDSACVAVDGVGPKTVLQLLDTRDATKAFWEGQLPAAVRDGIAARELASYASSRATASPSPSASPTFRGVTALLTGFRAPDIVDAIKAGGGTVAKTFNKSVTTLLVKDGDVSNAKTAKADAAGIPIVTQAEFRKAHISLSG